MEEKLQHILATSDWQGREGLVPLLQMVQEELGYVPEEAVSGIARKLKVSPGEVFGVLTFYAQFRLTPQGRHVIRVCRGTACHVRGGVAVRRALERVLSIRPGETTPDMEYTLETVACLGACALSPTMTIDDRVYGLMTAQRVEEMFAGYKGGQGEQDR